MENYSGFTRINIGGKDRPFYYGVATGRVYCQHKEEILRGQGKDRPVEFEEFAEDMRKAFGGDVKNEKGEVVEHRAFDPFKATDIIYACLVAGCRYATYELKEREAVDFTAEQVDFWIQTMAPEQWAAAGKAIAGANVSPNASEPQQEAAAAPAK